jgi:proteasome lid subunit RPN8/RPN11
MLGALWRRLRRQKHLPVTLPRHIWLSELLLDVTARRLRLFRDDYEEHETIAYWAGVETPEQWWMMACLTPQADTAPGAYQTTASANAEVILLARQYGLHILGQVHSHPGGWVDHSPGDVLGAFMPFEGFLSIVVPFYASQGMKPLNSCGVHRFEQGRFRRLSNGEVGTLFRVIPMNLTTDERDNGDHDPNARRVL